MWGTGSSNKLFQTAVQLQAVFWFAPIVDSLWVKGREPEKN